MGNEFLVKSKGNIFNLKSQETNNFKLNPEKGISFNVDSCGTVDNSSDIANKPLIPSKHNQSGPVWFLSGKRGWDADIILQRV